MKSSVRQESLQLREEGWAAEKEIRASSEKATRIDEATRERRDSTMV